MQSVATDMTSFFWIPCRPPVLDHRTTTTTSTSTASAITGRTVTIHHNNNNNNHPVLFLMLTCDFIYRVKTLSYTIPLLTNTIQVDPKMLFFALVDSSGGGDCTDDEHQLLGIRGDQHKRCRTQSPTWIPCYSPKEIMGGGGDGRHFVVAVVVAVAPIVVAAALRCVQWDCAASLPGYGCLGFFGLRSSTTLLIVNQSTQWFFFGAKSPKTNEEFVMANGGEVVW